MHDFVVAMTGASGSVYAVRLLQMLLETGHNVHLVISPAAADVLRLEAGLTVNLEHVEMAQLFPKGLGNSSHAERRSGGRADAPPGKSSCQHMSQHRSLGRLAYHHYLDYEAGIASGSFLTEGMVVCPCSMGTLAGIANGLSSNLIQRAADVHLKEHRKLIVVPRETPLGSIQLANMKKLADSGAIVLPAMPGFYHHPVTVQDLVDFIVGRVCDHLGVVHDLFRRWDDSRSGNQ